MNRIARVIFAVLLVGFITQLLFLDQSKDKIQNSQKEIKFLKSAKTAKARVKMTSPYINKGGSIDTSSDPIAQVSLQISQLDKKIKDYGFPHSMIHDYLSPEDKKAVISLLTWKEQLETTLLNLRYEKMKEEFQ